MPFSLPVGESTLFRDDILLKSFKKFANIILVEFNKEGFLSHCNEFARELIGADRLTGHVGEVFTDFHSAMSLSQLAESRASSILLHLAIPDNLPQSYYFSFFNTDEGYLAIGQPDVNGLEQVRDEILKINRDLDNTQRALLKRNAELTALNENLERNIEKSHALIADEQGKFKTLLDSTLEAIVGLDLDGVCTFTNRSCLDLLGLDSAKRLEGQDVHGIMHHSFRDGRPYPKSECTISKAIHDGLTISCERGFFWKADGSLLEVIYSLNPLIENGTRVGSVMTFNDVTHQRDLEEEQAYLRKRLESLWKISRLTDADLNDICDNVLAEMAEMTNSPYGFYGFLDETEEVMTIYSWSKNVMTDCVIHDRPLVFSIEQSGLWGNAVRYREPFLINDYRCDCENKTGTPEGHVTLTRVLSVPVIRSGRVVAVGAVANKPNDYTGGDISQLSSFLDSVQILIDRKHIEDTLREQEDHYRRLYKKTPAMMHSIDNNGVIVSVSDQWLDIMGYARDEVLGRKSTDFLTEESSAYARDIVLPAFFKTGKVFDVSYQLIKKNGELMDVLLSATAEYDNAGHFVRSLAVIVDVTEKNKLMHEQTRSAQLAALGTVAAGVAHEINNPIQGIMNYAGLLERDPDLSPRNREMSRRINHESQRVAKITRDLLFYSKDSRVDMKWVDLTETVETALSLITTKVKNQGINLDTEFCQELPRVLIQPQSIQQVVINLVDNACDALKEKDQGPAQKQIHVKTRQLVEKKGAHFCIEVFDTGLGMTEDVLNRSQEAFFTTKPPAEGTGLGLSIVADIVRKHNGRIELESKATEYTRVKVIIPMQDDYGAR